MRKLTVIVPLRVKYGSKGKRELESEPEKAVSKKSLDKMGNYSAAPQLTTICPPSISMYRSRGLSVNRSACEHLEHC